MEANADCSCCVLKLKIVNEDLTIDKGFYPKLHLKEKNMILMKL